VISNETAPWIFRAGLFYCLNNPYQRLRGTLALIRIIPRDAGFTSFLLHQPIMFALTFGRTLGLGLTYGDIQL
jgi:hypothetical protein